MILVVGATGLVGSEICYALACKGIPFRALVRKSSDPARIVRLKNYGAVLAEGDLCEPYSLRAACRGVEVVICTASAFQFSFQPSFNDLQKVDLEGVEYLIGSARAEGARQFIYISCSASHPSGSPLFSIKRNLEQRLMESGLPYTILRPGYLMETWLSPAMGFDPANATARVYGSGDQPIHWIAAKDVASYAAASLDNPFALNTLHELAGPESISPHQAIQLFEKDMGKTFEVTHVSPEDLQAQYDSATDPVQKSFIGLMLSYAEGDPIDKSATQKTFAVRLTSLQEYINQLNDRCK
jgi:NADH dehydrogenase